jgi:hypothetical protein
MPDDERHPPHPEREEEPEVPQNGRGGVILAVALGVVFVLMIVAHLVVGGVSH